MESCSDIKSDEIRTRKEEFDCDRDGVDWLMGKGMGFMQAVEIVNFSKISSISIIEAFIELTAIENE
jgi:hypothetical protein